VARGREGKKIHDSQERGKKGGDGKKSLNLKARGGGERPSWWPGGASGRRGPISGKKERLSSQRWWDRHLETTYFVFPQEEGGRAGTKNKP